MADEKTPLVAAPPLLSSNTVRFVALASAVAEGFDIGVYSGVVVRVQDEWGLTPMQVGILSGLLPIGIFVGVVISGGLADACGRLPALSVALVVLTASSLGMALALELWMLLLGRLAVGIGVGIGVHSVVLYVSETSPAASRGLWGSAFELFISAGILLGYVVNFALLGFPNDWRIMLGLGAVLPVVLLLVVFLGRLPESPRYLFLSGRHDEARATLTGFVGREEADATVAEWGHPEPPVSVADLLATPQRRRQLVTTFTLACVVMLSGMPIVMNFASLLLSEHFGDERLAFQVTLLMGFAKVVAIVVVMLFVIDAYGRVPLLFVSSLGVGACSFALAYAFTHQGTALTMQVLFCAWACFFELGLGPVPLVYIPEVLDTPVRSKGSSVAIGGSRLVPVVMVTAYPVVQVAHGIAPCFIAFGVCCVLSIPFIFFYCPETKQKKLEDLKDIF